MYKRAANDITGASQNPEAQMSPLDQARLEQFQRIDSRNYNRTLKRLGIADPETASARLSWKGLGRFLKSLGGGAAVGAGVGGIVGAVFGPTGAAGKGQAVGSGAVIGGAAGGVAAILAAAINGIRGSIHGSVDAMDLNRVRDIYNGTTPYSFYNSGWANA